MQPERSASGRWPNVVMGSVLGIYTVVSFGHAIAIAGSADLRSPGPVILWLVVYGVFVPGLFSISIVLWTSVFPRGTGIAREVVGGVTQWHVNRSTRFAWRLLTVMYLLMLAMIVAVVALLSTRDLPPQVAALIWDLCAMVVVLIGIGIVLNARLMAVRLMVDRAGRLTAVGFVRTKRFDAGEIHRIEVRSAGLAGARLVVVTTSGAMRTIQAPIGRLILSLRDLGTLAAELQSTLESTSPSRPWLDQKWVGGSTRSATPKSTPDVT